ncbi:hypothetical protein IPF86_03440 [Candidatus Nomurabacteria bacterium]|nr:MAG: hypothetical protein IPF86_03440 [Candidatus Nomurabacteria bacterium]
MENQNFSNGSAKKNEKETQNNEVSLGADSVSKKELGKKEKITLEINGQTIEAVKYYFEYPEKIQKESGILGYERTKISIDEKLISDEMEHYEQSKIITDLLVTLSDGEYPETCVTHKFGAYGSHEGFKKGFAEDKFFVQKIYDLDRIEKLKDEMDPNYIFNNNGAKLDIFNKKDNSPYSENTYGKIPEHQVYHEGVLFYETTPIAKIPKKILSNESEFYIKKDFYLEPGNFWHGVGIKDIGFGFSVLNDPFFLKYIEESILLDPEPLFKSEDSTTKDIFCIYLINEYHRLGYSFISNSSDDKTIDEIKRKFILKIDEIAKEFLKNKILSNGDLYNSEISMGKYATEKFLGRSGAFKGNYFVGNEIKIPIFMNHDNIPQLSWGHAKYAHYFNDKGLNFFKFKHADYLPKKE